MTMPTPPRRRWFPTGFPVVTWKMAVLLIGAALLGGSVRAVGLWYDDWGSSWTGPLCGAIALVPVSVYAAIETLRLKE
jgi:hypothetical protein